MILTKDFICDIVNNGYNHSRPNSKPFPYLIKFYTLRNSTTKFETPLDQGTNCFINQKPVYNKFRLFILGEGRRNEREVAIILKIFYDLQRL